MTKVILLPQSLVDAKGDLLVGSADNAVVRVPVGTDGKVLKADSTAAGGVSWQTPASTAPALKYNFISGRYYMAPNTGPVNQSMTPLVDYVYSTPRYLPQGQVFDRIGIPQLAASSSGTVVLSIYSAGPSGKLDGGSRLVDATAGTPISTGTTGQKEATINWTVPADGFYYLVAVFRTAAALIGAIYPQQAVHGSVTASVLGVQYTQRAPAGTLAADAPPATAPSYTWTDDTFAPLVYLRAA